VLPGHTQLVHAVTYSPDGSLLLSGSADGTYPVVGSIDQSAPGDAGRAPRKRCAGSPSRRMGASLAATYADTGVGLWDLTYYDRHIEGNTGYQRDRLAAQHGDAGGAGGRAGARGGRGRAIARRAQGCSVRQVMSSLPSRGAIRRIRTGAAIRRA